MIITFYHKKMPVRTERINTVEEIETAKKRIQSNYDFVKKQLDAIPSVVADLESGNNQHITIKPEYSPARIEHLRKTRIVSLQNEAGKYSKQIAGYQSKLDKLNDRLAVLQSQAPKSKVSATIDKESIDRLIYFRNKYVDKNQTKAAEKIGMNQAILSFVENYKRNIPRSAVTSLQTKYDLNVTWLLTGKGAPIVAQESPNTIRKSMLQMQLDLQTAETRIKVLEANTNRMYKLMEKMATEIEQLRFKVDK